MKKIFLTLMVLVSYQVTNAQESVSFMVDGICGMCEERIESTAMNTIGVISADWELDTKELNVSYETGLFQLEELHQNIANVGHDTDLIKATDEIYDQLHGCCKYRPDAPSRELYGYIYTLDENGEELPLIGANIYWSSDNLSSVSDMNGNFEIEKRLSENLIISYIGYEDQIIMIDQEGDLNILMSDNIQLDGVEVSQNRSSAQVSFVESLRVIKVSENEFKKAACCNLSESFSNLPSVDVATTDAVTGTRKIQMLGLAGPYVQIMKENMPYARGLASVGGLTYIPGLWVNGMMINQGSGSIVNGYESMAGQINIEMKKPDHKDKFFLNGYINTARRSELNLITNKQLNEDWSTGFKVHGSRHQYNHDTNNDGFLDMPKFNILALSNRWKYRSGENVMGQFGLEVYSNESVAGQVGFDPKTSARDEIWGSELKTKRIAFWTKRGIILDRDMNRSIGLQFSSSYEIHDDYFALRKYDATHKSLYFNGILQTDFINADNTIKAGLNSTYDNMDEELVDVSFDREEFVFGAFLEHTWLSGTEWTIVSGLRGDHHNNYGLFLTPRFQIRYAPVETLVFRANAGLGRRTPNVFADNLGYFASNRSFIIHSETNDTPYGLKQEISKGVGGSITKVFNLFGRDATFSVEAHYIEFENQAVIDIDASAQEVNIYNLEGDSYTKSIQSQFDFSPVSEVTLRFAYRYLDVQTDYLTGRLQKPLTSKHRAFGNVELNLGKGWSFDYTANWQGEQRLPDTSTNPEDFQLNEFSDDFVVSNIHITKQWNERFDIYLGSENLFDQTLENPIVDANNPFSYYFDSSMVWGPVFGRNVYLGFRWNIEN